MNELICTECCAVNFTEAKVTFLGNPRFFGLGLGILVTAEIALQGLLPIPGLILLAIIYGLGRDVRVRRRLTDARRRRMAMLRESSPHRAVRARP